MTDPEAKPADPTPKASPGAETISPWHDPTHPNNGPEHHTGAPCIDCDRPAGTYWSPLWCQPCNAKRMDRIGTTLRRLAGEPTP